MGGSFGDAVCAALAAIARLTHAGALTEEAVFVARKIAPAALAFPDDSSVRLAGAQLFAALASIDLRGRSELLAELYELMVSTDVAADARGSVRLWGGSVDGTLVCASSAALLLLCQLPPMAQPLKSREAAAASGGAGGGRGSEGVESEGGDAAEQGERVRDRSGRRKGEKEQCKDKDRRDKEKRKGDKLEKSKAKEAEAEASPAPGDEESQQLAEEGGGWGRDLCKMFFDLVGHRALGRGRSGQVCFGVCMRVCVCARARILSWIPAAQTLLCLERANHYGHHIVFAVVILGIEVVVGIVWSSKRSQRLDQGLMGLGTRSGIVGVTRSISAGSPKPETANTPNLWRAGQRFGDAPDARKPPRRPQEACFHPRVARC